MVNQYQKLQELRKAFLDAYAQKEWGLALTIQMEILQIYQDDEQNDTEEVAREMHNLGVVLDEMEELEKAEVCYERSANAKRMCSGATMSLADTLNNLGIVCHKLEKHKDGLEAHEEVLAIHNRYLEKNNRERVQTLWHLGNGYEANGAYAKAILVLEEVLQWAGRGTEYTKLELAQIYGETAFCYNKVGNYKKGIYAYERALHWLEKENEGKSFAYLQYLWALSDLCDASGYGDLAVEYGDKAINLEKERYRRDEISAAYKMNEFALLCRKYEAYVLSIQWHEVALTIMAEKFGETHLEYRKMEIYLAMCYFARGEKRNSEEGKVSDLQMVVEILEGVMAKNPNADGKDLVQSLAVSALLAKVEHERGNHAKDMEYLKHMALDLFWKIDIMEEGAMDAVLLVARLLYETGIYEGALYCIEMIGRNAKKSQESYLRALHLYGEIWKKHGWKEGFVVYGQVAKNIVEELYPPTHPEVAKSWKHLGVAYRETGDFIQANKYFEHALVLETEMLDEDNPSRIDTLMSLAEVAFWQGRYEDSISYLKERNDLNFEETKKDLMDAAVALLSIGIGYLAMGDEEKAAAYKIESEKKLEKSGVSADVLYQQQLGIYEKLQNGIPLYYGEEVKEVSYGEAFTEVQALCTNLGAVLQAIQERGGSISEKDTFMASCIAGVYRDCGAYKEALQWYQMAEKWSEEDEYLRACISVGHMYLALGEYDKALRQYVNAKEYILEYKDMEGTSLCMISGYIGDAYVGMGEDYLAVQAYIGWERKYMNLQLPQGSRYRTRVHYNAKQLEEMGNEGLAVTWYEKYLDALTSCCPKGEEYARVQLKLVELLMYKELPETCVGMLDEILALGEKMPSRTTLPPEIFDKMGQLYFTLEEEEKSWEALVLAYEGSKMLKQSMSKEGLWIFFQLLQEKE